MVLAEPIFVGRKKELDDLTQLLERAIAGKGLTLFISGEAGSGKTRLITEFLKTAKNKDVTVLAGWCLSDAAVPYFPFVEAFDSYLSRSEMEGASAINQKIALKSWLSATNQSELSEKFMNMQPNVWKDRAFHEVTKELLLLSTKKPLILILEDIHWADSASLSLLHYLARQVGSERILILATFREEELVDSTGHPNQLTNVLLLMGRDDLYKEIKLSNLEFDDVGRIAESMLGGKVFPELVEKLTLDSRGIPLYIVEALRMLYQQESLSKKNGQWNLCVDTFKIPQKVRDVILGRLNALTHDQRQILDVASVVGEKFEPKLVAAIIACDYADVLMTLNEIAKTTLMVSCEETSYRFDHIKFREMLYEEIPFLLKKEYHLRAAEKLESVYPLNPKVSVSDLAYHFVNAEKKNKAIKHSLQAGKVALSRFSNQEAIKHFSYVINAIADNQEFISEKLSALEGLGDALLASSMFKESVKVHEELADSTENGAVKLRAFRKAMDSAFQLGDHSHLLELLKKAEPYATADRLEHAKILVCRGRALHLQSMMPEAIKDMETALQVFEEEYSIWEVAWALIGLGVYHTGQGKSQQGLAESLLSIALFEELGDFRWQLEAYYVAGMAFNLCFLEHEALKMFAKVVEIDIKEKIGDYLRLLYANVFSSRSSESIGDFETALSYSQKALELVEKTDSISAKALIYSNITRQFARLGNIEKAEEYFRQLVQVPPEILGDIRVTRWLAALAEPVLYSGKGEWEKANGLFTKIMKDSDAPDFHEFTLGIVKTYYIWALQNQGRFKEAENLIEETRKNRQRTEDKFKHVYLFTNFMVPTKVNAGQTFEVRLDIINVSRGHGTLIGIKNLIDPMLEMVYTPNEYSLKDDTTLTYEDALNPFQVKTVKLSFQAKYPGEISLTPEVLYIDDLGKTKKRITKNIHVIIEPKAILTEADAIVTFPQIKSDYTHRTFDFLVKAFLKDYKQKKLPLEKSGWRTRMEIVKNGQVSKHSMYGRSGRGGEAKSELERLGLVESRFFLGERGRGGQVLKLRICPEKETVKQHINQH